MKTLGDKIRAIRLSKGLTQEALAFELEMSLGAYSRIERNLTDLSFSRIEQIAKFFKISVIELLSYGGKPSKDAELQRLRKIIEEKDKEIMLLQKKLIKLMENKKRGD